MYFEVFVAIYIGTVYIEFQYYTSDSLTQIELLTRCIAVIFQGSVV